MKNVKLQNVDLKVWAFIFKPMSSFTRDFTSFETLTLQ